MQETKETENIQNPSVEEPAATEKNPTHEKKHIRLYIVLGTVLGTVILIYFLIGLRYRKVFFPATTVNDINVSGLTPEKAQELLNSGAADYILTIIEDGEITEQISGSDIGLYAKEDNSLRDIISGQNTATWAFQYFQNKNYSLDMEYEEEKLFSAVNSLSCMDKKNWASPEDAYITYVKGEGYKIVPEIAGTEILTDSFLEAAAAAVDHLDDTLSLRETGVYKLPEVSSDDSVLNERFAKLQPYSDMTVTYQFGSQTEVLDSDTLSEWISLNKSGRLIIDEEAAAEFVKGLAKKYNTAYAPKTLKTSYGDTITIKGGFYGWQINRETETENLLQIIRDGKSVTREPDYLLSAASHDGADYGNTYVEINLTAQHLFYYKDGELLIESDFVSGNVANGNATPAGAYAITYTQRNATLRGQNYATPVSYWMPFNGNIGMHDSSWRSSFGGTIYRTNGSHGCINLPPSVAKTIFENIEKGIPVLCYHLGGTEQKPNTLSQEQITAENNPAESQEPIDGLTPADTQTPPEEGGLPADVPPVPEEGGLPADVPPAPAEGNPSPDTPPVSPDGNGGLPENPVPPAE